MRMRADRQHAPHREVRNRDERRRHRRRRLADGDHVQRRGVQDACEFGIGQCTRHDPSRADGVDGGTNNWQQILFQ